MQKNKQFVILSKENYISSYISFPSASSHCPTYSSSLPDLSPSISTSPFFDASFMALFHFALRNSFTATLSNLYRRLLSRLPALPFSPLYSPPCNGSSFFFVLQPFLFLSRPQSSVSLHPRAFTAAILIPHPLLMPFFHHFHFSFPFFCSLSLSQPSSFSSNSNTVLFCFPCILSPTSLLFTPFSP